MDFLKFYRSRQPEMLHQLKAMVELESPSHDKSAVDRCSRFILKNFQATGSKIISFPQKQIGDLHLIEYPNAPESTHDNILILCHVDTVWPVGTLKNMPFFIEDSKAFGPGTLDMKAGLVMILSALKTLSTLKLSPKKKIRVFLDSYEEIGNEAVARKIRKLASASSLVLCLEPAIPGGAVKLRRKGRFVIRIRVKGKTAHAGSPGSGISAIDELMFQLKALCRLRTQHISLNVGEVSGGTAANVVASKAEALLDVRYWTTSQAQRIKTALKELKAVQTGARISATVLQEMPPMEHSRASAALFRKVSRIARDLDLELEGGRTGGGSDASYAATEGIPLLDGLGPDGDGIHAEHEHVLIPSLLERTALLTELLLRL